MSTKNFTEIKSTKTIRKFLKYYEIAVWYEIKSDSTSTLYTRRRFPIVYIVSRLIVVVSIIQLLRLFYSCILCSHETGSSIALNVSQLLFYIIAYVYIPYYDIGVFISEILPNLEKTVVDCEDIWNKIGCMYERSRTLQKEMSFNMWRIFLHNCFFDYVTFINIGLTTFGDLANLDPIMLYSEIPWKNSVVDFVYWTAGMLLVLVMQMTWSWLFALPGCLAFQYQYLLKGLSAHLKSKQNFGCRQNLVMEYYLNLEYSTRLLFENGFSNVLLAFYFSLALQQTFTCFFIFNVVRNGGGWNDVQVYFIDLLCSTSRVFHGYYALSQVSIANEEFLKWFDLHLSKLEECNCRAKIIRKKARILRNLPVTVGPYKCDRIFPASGCRLYLDNLVTAALWK